MSATDKKKKIAILGFASSSTNMIPWNDSEFEFWACNNAGQYAATGKVTRWFDLHDFEKEIKGHPNKAYLAMLKTVKEPIYMQRKHEDIPSSIRYPIEQMVQRFGAYFTSTIAYMIALAIVELEPLIDRGKPAEERPVIALYGVDMLLDSEYATQRPCCEWLLGIAVGLGINVVKPIPSALLSANHLYGYQESPHPGFITSKMLERAIAKEEQAMAAAVAEKDKLLSRMGHHQGALNQLKFLIEHVKNFERGGFSLHPELPEMLPKPEPTNVEALDITANEPSQPSKRAQKHRRQSRK